MKVRVCDSCGDRLWPDRAWIKVRPSLHASGHVFSEIVGDYCGNICLRDAAQRVVLDFYAAEDAAAAEAAGLSGDYFPGPKKWEMP